MRSTEMFKISRSLAADLSAFNANTAELKANPLKPGPDMNRIMDVRNGIQARNEQIKNLGYLGDVPKPPRRVPNAGWGVMRDTNNFSDRLFNGIHEVPNPSAYRLPPIPTNAKGLTMPGVHPVGDTAHAFWRNQVTQRPGTESLLKNYQGMFPTMEKALGMAGMTGPNLSMMSRLPAGDSLALAKTLSGWRRSAMRGNPEFRTAYRRMAGSAGRFPGILRSLARAV